MDSLTYNNGIKSAQRGWRFDSTTVNVPMNAVILTHFVTLLHEGQDIPKHFISCLEENGMALLGFMGNDFQFTKKMNEPFTLQMV